MEGSIRRLCVYQCTNKDCNHILFTSYDWVPNSRREKLCKECGSTFEKIGDNYNAKDFPNVKFVVKGKTAWGDDFIIAFFKKKCPGCGTVGWYPWLRGEINYTCCPTCMMREEYAESQEMKTWIEQDKQRREEEGYDGGTGA